MIRTALAVALTAALTHGASPEEFFRAIRNGDTATLRKLAADRTSVNHADARGVTPLHYTAAFGTTESLKLLLAAGAQVNAKNNFDATPLVLAAYSPEKIRVLLAAGADPKASTKAGRTPLLVAAGRNGATAAVRSLLDAGSDVNESDAQGVTALIAAGFAGEADTVKLLLNRGASVNTPDREGSTALVGAAAWNSLETVRALLAKGADVNASNHSSGKVRHGNIALTKLTPLILASAWGSVDLVRALLDAGAKVNVQDGRGITPLMAAVSSENQDLNVINALIKAGADVNAKDLSGDTVLDWARKVGNPLTAGLLESAGAKGSAKKSATAGAAGPGAVHEALDRSLDLLGKSSAEFFSQTGCIGCHHQPASARAFRVAGREIRIADVIARSLTAARPVEPVLLQFIDIGGEVDTAGNIVAAAAAVRTPASSTTDALVHYIAGKQHADGSWGRVGISRAPSEETAVSRTAMAVHAIRTYGWPARRAEWDERIARARRWMLRVEPRTSYERAELLLGLHWSGAKAADLERVAAGLKREQRDDGGWSQNRHLSSDAYATGLALHALHETRRMKASDAAYRNGVAFLLKTQLEDGSWLVRSRSPKFQPYFQSGFPHEHDQWISATATAYAAMAIAPALEPATQARRD